MRHIRAIDGSAKMIEIAKAKSDAQNIANVAFEHATIEQLTVPAQTLDAVLGLSVLHLLANKEEVVAKVYEMLKPGGIFVTSTSCLGGSPKFFPLRLILPIGRLFGRLPMVKFLTREQLERCMTTAGFTIDHQQPGKGKAVFIVAIKPTTARDR